MNTRFVPVFYFRGAANCGGSVARLPEFFYKMSLENIPVQLIKNLREYYTGVKVIPHIS